MIRDAAEAEIDRTARDWLRGVADAGFVPGARARARAALRDLLDEAIAAVRAEPFDPAPGYRIGVELVELRMSAPAVAGTTTRLLADRLPSIVAGDPEVIRDRVLRLLDQLVTGFVTAQRDAAVSAAEQINRSEKIHWRRVQTELQQRLQDALLHDPQTGLPNPQFLLQHLASLLPGWSRLGLCVLGVDGHAELTDALGPDNGDRILAAVATRLTRVADQGGYFLAHLGADRFALLVTGTSGADEVVKMADKARRALSPAFPVDGYFFTVGVTAGITEGLTGGTRAEDWLRNAHLALDWAREDHREYAVFEPLRADADRFRHRMAAALPAALARGEFVPHYQPIHRLDDRTVAGVEALARWNRPGGAPTLGPEQFISIAERTGLIRPLGRTLLEQACRAAADRPFLLSVNLSPLQLDQPALAADVADILRRTGLPAERLQLEITESTAVGANEDGLRQLAALGIRLAVDDFGTGYASLAALSRLPVSGVKLAAELLSDGSAAAVTVLRHTIDLCHDLGVQVTAEGIETAEQEDLLRSLGCDLGQGFYLGRPAPELPLPAV